MTRATFLLPLPPSANRLWIRTKGGNALSPEYRAWKKEAGWIVKAARQPKIEGRYGVVISLPEKMRGDSDNRIKATLDLLRSVGATDDDKHNADVRAVRSASVERGKCHVEVFAIRASDRDAGEAGFSDLASISAP